MASGFLEARVLWTGAHRHCYDSRMDLSIAERMEELAEDLLAREAEVARDLTPIELEFLRQAREAVVLLCPR